MEEMMDTQEYIIGRNSVREALKGGAQIDSILVVRGTTDGSIRELLNLAHKKGLLVKEVSRYKMDEISQGLGPGGKIGNHQGVAALVPAFEYSELEDIFALAEQRGQPPFILILDSIQDPHNLGAILRSAEALGAHGAVIGKHRAAGLTAAVYKVSSGAAQYIPVVKATNLNQVVQQLKNKNIWVAAADQSGQDIASVNLTGAMAMVIGGEGTGVSKYTKDLCDHIVRIPMEGNTPSLNAACAASIVLYEKKRQDRAKKG